MKIIPLADRVVIKTVEVEETTKGGLILTGSAKEKPQVAQVIAVGPGGVQNDRQGRRQGAHQQVFRHRGQSGWRGVHHRAPERHPGRRGRLSGSPYFWKNAALKGAMYYGKADQAGRGRPQGTVCRY